MKLFSGCFNWQDHLFRVLIVKLSVTESFAVHIYNNLVERVLQANSDVKITIWLKCP